MMQNPHAAAMTEPPSFTSHSHPLVTKKSCDGIPGEYNFHLLLSSFGSGGWGGGGGVKGCKNLFSSFVKIANELTRLSELILPINGFVFI